MVIKFRFNILSLFALTLLTAVLIASWTYSARRNARINNCVRLIAAIDAIHNENPIAIISALNQLKRMGHSDAVTALRRFDQQHEYSNESVEIIVPLLFYPCVPNEKLPLLLFDDSMSYELSREEWDSEIEVVDGIPFATEVFRVTGTTLVYSRSYLLDWADERAAIQSKSLTPTDDPFTASERLISIKLDEYRAQEELSEERLDVFTISLTNKVKDQVFQMVKHLVPSAEVPKWKKWHENPDLWKQLRDNCLNHGIRWCENEESYLFTK